MLFEVEQMELAIELRVTFGVSGAKGIPVALTLPHIDRKIDIFFGAMAEETRAPISGMTFKQVCKGPIGAEGMFECRRLLWMNAITIENLDHGDLLPTLRRGAPPL